MVKTEFVGEFEMRASNKILYPFISSASGLSQWFADDVSISNEDKIFTFVWDGEESRAKVVSSKLNNYIKFEFIDSDDQNPNFVEFMIDINEMTDTTFIRVTDYSDMDKQEAQDLWENMIHDLKEIVGG